MTSSNVRHSRKFLSNMAKPTQASFERKSLAVAAVKCLEFWAVRGSLFHAGGSMLCFEA